MTLVYRTVLDTELSATDTLDHLTAIWDRWLAQKYPGVELPTDHAAQFDFRGHAVTLIRRRTDADMHLDLAHRDGPRVWSTTIRSGPHPDSGQWVQVDTSVTGGLPHGTLNAAPRFMPEVVAALRPTIGGLPLMVNGVVEITTASGVEVLSDLIASPQRQHTVIVAVDDARSRAEASEGGTTLTETLHRTHRAVAGAADVFMVSGTAPDILAQRLGRRFTVHSGGARVYLPGLNDPTRHRYAQARNYLREDTRLLPHLAASRVAGYTAGRPAPATFTDHLNTLSATETSDHELLALALDAADLAEAQRDVAQTERADMELLLIQSQLGEIGLSEEIAEQDALIAQLRADNARLARLVPATAQHAAVPSVAPRSWSGIGEALAAAREDFPWLAWADGAPVQVSRMDEHPAAATWGRKVYDGLSALNAYCHDVNEGTWSNGGFYGWIKLSGNSPITPSKVAMGESDTVLDCDKTASARRFPLPEPWGKGTTFTYTTHLKPLSHGGNTIPRVYFDLRPYPLKRNGGDDPDKHLRGKMHALIGFVGPHYLVPNTKP